MRIINQFSILCLLFIAVSCSSDLSTAEKVEVTTAGGPMLSVTEDFFDFGTVSKGAEVVHLFKVSNSGDQPLIISDCVKTCGCTVPQCDKNPISPGGSSEIKITYDSERLGPFNKTIKVVSNSVDGDSKIIRIKGEVVDEANGQSENSEAETEG